MNPKCSGCIHQEVCLATGSAYGCSALFKPVESFVEIPVQVGQVVWFDRNKDGKFEETYVEKVILKRTGWHMKLACNAMYETSCRSIGKTVFLGNPNLLT